MKSVGVAPLSAFAAHLSAWGAALFLCFVPTYRGSSETAAPDGGRQVTSTSATLVEVNGHWVLWLLLVPVVLTAIAFAAALLAGKGPRLRRVTLWSMAMLLLALSLLAGFSIGLYFLPAALALTVAAVSAQSERTP